MTENATTHAAHDDEAHDVEGARKHYQAGNAAAAEGDRWAAIDHLEAAFDANPEDAEICFKLAYHLDLVGEEDEALHLYEEVVQRPNAPLNALINLAVLYEDRSQYAQAERCLQQVLATDPNHKRANLYMKDVGASKSAIIEDDHARKFDAQSAILDTPVTDFDMTVRTRNALRKMAIRTLGDLLRISEAELRSYKNLGEASIEEIKAMLAQRGLRLGQATEQQNTAALQAVYDQIKSETGQDDSVLSKSVNELNLSVRARKALALLNINTIGEIAMRTEAELMGVKNFGTTSLHEIKDKLVDFGLTLRKVED